MLSRFLLVACFGIASLIVPGAIAIIASIWTAKPLLPVFLLCIFAFGVGLDFRGDLEGFFVHFYYRNTHFFLCS